MLHGGKTRKNTRPLRLARLFAEIMEHQYKRDESGGERLRHASAFAFARPTGSKGGPILLAEARIPASAKLLGDARPSSEFVASNRTERQRRARGPRF